MRRRVLLAAVFPCAIIFAAAVRGDDGGVPSVDQTWLRAMKAGDLNGVVACYASDAVMWLPDAPEARGTKAIRDVYAGWFAAYTVVDAALTNTTYRTSGDLSTGWGNFMLKLQPKAGGEPVVAKGRFTAVATRVGGKWLYIADQASNEPPPPAPAVAAR